MLISELVLHMDVGREILAKGEASIVATSKEIPVGLPPTDLDSTTLNCGQARNVGGKECLPVFV